MTPYPSIMIDQWKEEVAREPELIRKQELWRLVERYQDQGHGSCMVRNPVAAKIVQDNLLHHHGSLFVLHDWIVMPNHVHVLLTPHAGASLERITHACKSYTSHEIERRLGGEGRLWEPDYFDRLIRNERHFEGVSHYIRRNPVKAGLVQDATLWVYGSASPRMKEKLEGTFTDEPSVNRGAGGPPAPRYGSPALR